MAKAVSENENKNCEFDLKRNDFGKVSKTLFKDKRTADFWFLFGSGAEQQRIPVHKAILAKESEAFDAMFYGEVKEQKNEVEIKDADADEFTEFLQFFYTDTVTISIKNVAKIMYLAKKYLVTELLKLCDEFIIKHLPMENILLGYELAILYDRFELKANLEQKIGENAKQVFATDEFRQCSHDTLKNILEIDQLMCDPKDVFDACIDWAKNLHAIYDVNLSEMENFKQQLGECFYLIPFSLMRSKQILKIVDDYEELFDRAELIDLINLTSSSGRIALKKFKYKNGYAAYSNKNWAWWWNHIVNDEHKKWINRREVVNISYTNKNVLKAIKPLLIWHMGERGLKILSGDMKIVQNAKAESKEEILLKQPIQIRCHQTRHCTESGFHIFKLAKPIVLEPNEKYEIQIDFDDSWSAKMFYTLKTSSESTEIMPLLCLENSTLYNS